MSPKFVSALGKVAAFTAKGAAITFGSTIVSCIAACYIEVGANQLIYKLDPTKFADIESASGITQDQLDAVRRIALHDNKTSTVTSTTHQQQLDEFHHPELLTPSSFHEIVMKSAEQDFQSTTTENEVPTTTTSATNDNNNKTLFWTERRTTEEEKTVGTNVDIVLSNLTTFAMDLPRREILACAMTC
jgi:hypothetical protein